MPGTIQAASNFDAKNDAEALRGAMKGMGCDDKGIMNVLCHRSNQQRQEIRKQFKCLFGKDLVDNIKSEMRGNIENLMVALIQTPEEYDSHCLRNAMKGAGSNESVLMEIVCSRTNAELKEIKSTYAHVWSRDLEKDLISETSGSLKNLFVSLVQGNRNEGSSTDAGEARQDADKLYQAGEKKWGTDEAAFNAVMATQSMAQLRLIFEQYQQISGKDIEKSIKSEFSGDIETALITIVNCARNLSGYFAERLYKSMKGLGTNDSQLVRVMVSRSEKDLVEIKQEFQKMYGKSLGDFISGDCSGNYRDALLKICNT